VASLAKSVEVSVFTLGDPYRVIVELPQVALHLPQSPEGKGLVKAFRSGVFSRGKTRIVLDTTGPVLVEKAVVSQPAGASLPQLTVDLVSTDRPTFLAGQSRQLLAGAAAGPAQLGMKPGATKSAVRPERKPVIVIDPGHGGHDSGAIKNGTVEKEVVLAFSLMLREKLEATGRFKVLMTRSTDAFVELDERRDFAKRHNADLFVAIHADYVPSGYNARGATIYTLRESVAKSIARGAGRQSSDDMLSTVELDVDAARQGNSSPDLVKQILADLASRTSKPVQTQTNFFAKNVIDYMGQSTELKDEPHREAAFRVLKSALVPSVLIELAYVSNKQDAANLKSEAWRDKVSSSIVGAINRYFAISRLPL
jgi:N-acetylmuramoyl-L-alanine amidase